MKPCKKKAYVGISLTSYAQSHTWSHLGKQVNLSPMHGRTKCMLITDYFLDAIRNAAQSEHNYEEGKISLMICDRAKNFRSRMDLDFYA